MEGSSGHRSATASNEPSQATEKLKAKSSDPAWKYSHWVSTSNKNAVYCELCNKIYNGGIKRQKEHLIGGFKNIIKCPNTTTEIAREMNEYMEKNKRKRPEVEFNPSNRSQEGGNDDDLVFFNSRNTASSEISVLPKKKPNVRGPMDGFVRPSPEEVVASRKMKGKQVQSTIEKHYKEEERAKTNEYVARWFYQAGIPFNTVNLTSFQVMVEAIGQYGPGYKPPSYHELREPLLAAEVKKVDDMYAEHMKAWEKYGCTLMSDGWTDKRGRSLMNFLVNSPEGTFFMESIDVSDKIHNSQFVFEQLDKRIQKIGEKHVVQVVTDNASNYVAAGALLMEKIPHLYWTPCAAHCLDLMLEDLGNMTKFKGVISKARGITTFIYRHNRLISEMRKKTGGDLVRTAVTRFATAFLTLESLFINKVALRELFISDVWVNSDWAKNAKGKRVCNTVMSNSFWRGLVECLKAAQPMVKILRLVDGDEKPPMGYLYAAIEDGREKIKNNFNGN